MKENTQKFLETEGSFPLPNDPRLYINLLQYRNIISVLAVLYGTYKCPGEITPDVATFL